MSARPLALGDSELMTQHQDLRVLPPRLPPRQAQHRHRTGTRSRKSASSPQAEDHPISGRPKTCSPGTRTRDRAKRDLQSICPGGAGFRHLQAQGGQPGDHPGRGAAQLSVLPDSVRSV